MLSAKCWPYCSSLNVLTTISDNRAWTLFFISAHLILTNSTQNSIYTWPGKLNYARDSTMTCQRKCWCHTRQWMVMNQVNIKISPFWSWNQNITGQLVQCQACWCPAKNMWISYSRYQAVDGLDPCFTGISTGKVQFVLLLSHASESLDLAQNTLCELVR